MVMFLRLLLSYFIIFGGDAIIQRDFGIGCDLRYLGNRVNHAKSGAFYGTIDFVGVKQYFGPVALGDG